MEVMGVIAVVVNCALIGMSGQIHRLVPSLTTTGTVLLIVGLEVGDPLPVACKLLADVTLSPIVVLRLNSQVGSGGCGTCQKWAVHSLLSFCCSM